MRPTHLSMKGFSIFREPVEIDFGDTDVFAIVGPTGAGKSSIIDAIVFALYGSVSRYRNAKLVAPVVNQSSNEARVRLDFTIADEAYTAVRIVRRTHTGATTKEARLERGDTTLAGNARELDEAVVRLIGLTFEQFTKTVVLPQGDFAEFLTDNATDRQTLLRRLLGVERFRAMATHARERAKIAAGTAESLNDQLHTAVRAAEQLPELVTRLDAVTELGDDIAHETELTNRAEAEAKAASDTAAKLAAQLAVLDDVVTPDGTSDISDQLDAADRRLDDAQAEVDRLGDELESASARVSDLPAGDDVRSLLADHDALEQARLDHRELELRLDEMETELHDSANRRDRAHAALADVDRLIADLRVRAGLEGLRDQLARGEPCPLCEQIVEDLPSHDPNAELAEVEAERDRHAAVLVDASRGHEKAVRTDAEVRAELVRTAEVIERLEARVGSDDREQTRKTLDDVVAARAALDATQQRANDAVGRLRTATRQRQELLDTVERHRRVFSETRDRLAGLDPPAPTGRSLHADWVELVEWAAHRSAALRRQLIEAETAAGAASDRAEKHRDVLAVRCATFLEAGEDHPLDPIAWQSAAVARIEERIATARERSREADQLRNRVEQLEAEGAVAATLGQLLGANGFEQWLMEDAMHGLALRATERLLDLSRGAYSLVVDGGDFAVRDHHNADEVRPARTLSGGETFLASLALALALADSVADLSTAGTPFIEAMFLDEGFGTLDADTLDVVTSALEELGARGRMVGVVTHIPALADRLPVALVVQRSANTSTIRRVER